MCHSEERNMYVVDNTEYQTCALLKVRSIIAELSRWTSVDIEVYDICL